MSQIKPDELRVRFDLKSVFVALTGLAFAYALLFSVPTMVGVPCLLSLSVMLPAFLTAGVVYGNGKWRAFCIGGLFPGGVMLLVTVVILWFGIMGGYDRRNYEDLSDAYRLMSVVSWMMIGFVGACTVVIWHMSQREDQE